MLKTAGVQKDLALSLSSFQGKIMTKKRYDVSTSPKYWSTKSFMWCLLVFSVNNSPVEKRQGMTITIQIVFAMYTDWCSRPLETKFLLLVVVAIP